ARGCARLATDAQRALRSDLRRAADVFQLEEHARHVRRAARSRRAVAKRRRPARARGRALLRHPLPPLQDGRSAAARFSRRGMDQEDDSGRLPPRRTRTQRVAAHCPWVVERAIPLIWLPASSVLALVARTPNEVP